MPCSQQGNGIDCGLFTVVVILHLLQNVAISADSFSQEDISGLRSDIVAACDDETLAADPTRNAFEFILPDLVRRCFPLISNADDSDVELVGLVAVWFAQKK